MTTLQTIKYVLTRKAKEEQQRIEREAWFRLKKGESVKLTQYALDMLALPRELPGDEPPDADSPGSGQYEAIHG